METRLNQEPFDYGNEGNIYTPSENPSDEHESSEEEILIIEEHENENLTSIKKEEEHTTLPEMQEILSFSVYTAASRPINQLFMNYQRSRTINGIRPLRNRVKKLERDSIFFPFYDLTAYVKWVKAEYDEMQIIVKKERLEKWRKYVREKKEKNYKF